MPEPPAPIVHVQAASAPEPAVHVEPPVVHVQVAAPEVTVQAAAAGAAGLTGQGAASLGDAQAAAFGRLSLRAQVDVALAPAVSDGEAALRLAERAAQWPGGTFGFGYDTARRRRTRRKRDEELLWL